LAGAVTLATSQQEITTMSCNEEIRAFIVKNDQVIEVQVTPHKDPILCYVRPVDASGIPYGQRDMRLLSGVLSSKDAALSALHSKLAEDRTKLMRQVDEIKCRMDALVDEMSLGARRRHVKVSEA